MTKDFTKNKAALLQLKKPKAVIFDWDNTLVDTWPLICTAIDTTLISLGKEPWGLEKVRDNVHKSMRESFAEIFADDWQQASKIYQSTYRSIHLDKIELLPNSLELINKLAEKGVMQFVVSNKIGLTLRKEVKRIEKLIYAFVNGARNLYGPERIARSNLKAPKAKGGINAIDEVLSYRGNKYNKHQSDAHTRILIINKITSF